MSSKQSEPSRHQQFSSYVRECQDQQEVVRLIGKHTFESTRWGLHDGKYVFSKSNVEMLCTTIKVIHPTEVKFYLNGCKVNHQTYDPGIYTVLAMAKVVSPYDRIWAECSDPTIEIWSYSIPKVRKVPSNTPVLSRHDESIIHPCLSFRTTKHPKSRRTTIYPRGGPLIGLQFSHPDMLECKLFWHVHLGMGTFSPSLNKRIQIGSLPCQGRARFDFETPFRCSSIGSIEVEIEFHGTHEEEIEIKEHHLNYTKTKQQDGLSGTMH